MIEPSPVALVTKETCNIVLRMNCMSVVYVLTTPMPEDGGDNLTVEQVRKRAKWDNDDYVYRGLILNGTMTTKHHDTRVDPNKKPKVTYWKCGKPKHLKRDCEAGNVGNKANGSDTKGLVDGLSLNVDSRETIHVCKDRCWFKTYESLNDGSILHMGNKSTALVHGRGCVDLRLNIISNNIGSAFMSTSKLNDSILWHAKLVYVHFKWMQDMSKDGLILSFDIDIEKWMSQGFWVEAMVVLRLPDPKLKTLGERSIECIFVRYAEHSKVFRLYVIEPNDSVEINSIIESRDAIFDENKFSLVLRPSQRSLVKGTEDSGGSVVPEKVTREVVQQPAPELRKSKRYRTPKDFRPEF
ncbi:hypothetical protein Tco_1324999 [Tanacetum coccineum]